MSTDAHTNSAAARCDLPHPLTRSKNTQRSIQGKHLIVSVKTACWSFQVLVNGKGHLLHNSRIPVHKLCIFTLIYLREFYARWSFQWSCIELPWIVTEIVTPHEKHSIQRETGTNIELSCYHEQQFCDALAALHCSPPPLFTWEKAQLFVCLVQTQNACKTIKL